MTIKNLLNSLTESTNVRIAVCYGGDATETLYEGKHESVPYTLVDKSVYGLYIVNNRLNIMFYHTCIDKGE